MTLPKIYGEYFYGNKISDYGLEHNRVDYATLAKSFDAVLNNYIYNKSFEIFDYECWDIVNGEDGYWENEVFQWFIIDSAGVDILKRWTDEIVVYSSELDIYLWGVTHYGTSWNYVLTDIEIER